MKEYTLSTGAEFDLDEIWEYIALDNIDAVGRWIGKLFTAFDSLARTPEWDISGKISLLIRSYSGR